MRVDLLLGALALDAGPRAVSSVIFAVRLSHHALTTQPPRPHPVRTLARHDEAG